MIPEREREALMRLTMCAREECGMCEYKHKCDFNFQYELATESMNILADALRVADTPQLEVTREEFEKIAEQIKSAPLRLERLEDYQEPYCEVADTPQMDCPCN